jgi:predicted NUDIX family NTP pyrophosphohydrolase
VIVRKQSAGILLYRWVDNELQVLLAHPGGPIWENRDMGAWTIPKGEIAPNEETLEAALREFNEETSLSAQPPYLSLGSIVQKSGKEVWAWASLGDADTDTLFSNTYKIQWPRKSGKFIEIPEIDRYGWFNIEEASFKMNPAQVDLLDALIERLEEGGA